MKRKMWMILSSLVALMMLLFSFQNFTYKKDAKKDPNSVFEKKKESAVQDFNAMIEESQQSQKQLAQDLQKAHPPEKVERDGLISRKDQMRREKITGTEESVAAKTTKTFFQNSPQKQINKDADVERLSQELDSNP